MYMRKMLLAIFLCSFHTLVAQQNIVVESFRLLENDLTANLQGTMEYDQNGEVSALIKISTTEQGFVFDGGMMGVVKSLQKTGEIWLYVPHGIKKISIHHQQLGSLRDYYFPIAINKARTYEMRLSTGKVETLVTKSAGKQYVMFHVSPSNAMVEIDNQFLSVNNEGYAEKAMPYGTYTYRVSCNNYHTEAGVIQVSSKEKTEINVQLRPDFGWLKLDTDEEFKAAQVYIDGERVGELPYVSSVLKSGTHRVRLVKPMYESYEQEVRIFDNDTTNLSIRMKANFAKVTIESDENTEIWIDGRYKGKALWQGNLEPGDYTLEWKKVSHRTKSEVLHVQDYSPRMIRLPSLTPIFSQMDISSTPSKAKVYVDSVYQGETPIFLSEVLVGKREVSLQKDGYFPQTKVVEILESEETKLQFSLEEKPSESMVTITSSPSKAAVRIDGQEVGETPMTIPLTLGEHLFHVSKSEKYQPYCDYRKIENFIPVNYQHFDLKRLPKQPKKQPYYSIGYSLISIYGNADVNKSFNYLNALGTSLQVGVNLFFVNMEYMYQNNEYYHRDEYSTGVSLPVGKRILVTPQFGMDLTNNLWTLATRVQYCVNNFLSFYTTPEYVFLGNSGYFNDPYDMEYYIQGFCIRAGISLSLAINTKDW